MYGTFINESIVFALQVARVIQSVGKRPNSTSPMHHVRISLRHLMHVMFTLPSQNGSKLELF